MLSENIKNYRKEKGFSQETLAQELGVVRQTVSKWEKNLSVPDAEMLTKISEVLDVPVMTLLGGIPEEVNESPDNSDIANQLYILNNQFAKELYRRRKVRKIILIVLLAIFVIIPVLFSFLFMARKTAPVSDGYSTQWVESEIFSDEEIDSAIEAVADIFDNGWKGCYLRELSYAGDDIVKRELEYHGGDLKEGELILIKTVFYVAKHGGDGSLNTDFTYDNWYWILEKTSGGRWVELDYGVL